MKIRYALAIFAAVVAACSTVAYADDIVADSRITAVTVYPDAALVTRTAAVKLPAGASRVVFANIVPEIDENSLRASGVGTGKVTILGAQVKREFLEQTPEEKTRALQEQIQQLGDERRKLEDTRRALGEDKQFLDGIRSFAGQQLPKDVVSKLPGLPDIEGLFKFLQGRGQENYAQLQDADVKIREADRKLDALRRELAQVAGGARAMRRSIAVDVEAQAAASVDMNVSYLVPGAYWQPIYDARADFDKGQVELVSYGVVAQTTGEDWKDVAIALSTAKPNVQGRLPYVAPWFLRPLQVHEMRKSMVAMPAAQTMAFRDESVANKEALEGTVGGEGKSADAISVAYGKAQDQGLSVIYRLAAKADVKSDGTEHKLPVSSQMLKAEFKYSTYPRLAPYAYLGSRVTNAKDMQLLAGRVNVFLNGDYVGTSGIDNVGTGEEFDLYLGVDENVKVKREEIARKTDDVMLGGIPSPNRKVTFTYKLTVENYKNKPVKVILFEAVPVSQDERIKVALGQVSQQPVDKNWKDRKGIWRWELSLEPKQKNEITYGYAVECPRDMQVEGL